jgi:hypothetical protein
MLALLLIRRRLGGQGMAPPTRTRLDFFRHHERLAIFAGQVLVGFRIADAGEGLRIEVDGAANAVGNVG